MRQIPHHLAQSQDTHLLVHSSPQISFVCRNGKPAQMTAGTFKLPVERIRFPKPDPPALSLLIVRWGGVDRVGDGINTESDGDWGNFGCPPSDRYIQKLVQLGVLPHPILNPPTVGDMDVDSQSPFNFELLSLFVRDSRDTAHIASIAPIIAAAMHGMGLLA